MSTTNRSKSPEELRASLEEAIRSADEPVNVEHIILGGDELPPPQPRPPTTGGLPTGQPAARSPLPPITGPKASAVAEDDPTLEQPVVEELLQYTSDEVGVLVLTRDDPFYDTVQSAVGNDYPVLYAQTRKEALDAVLAGDCGVLITDAGHSPLEVEQLTIELKQHLPSLVTIVAGRRDDGDALMHLLSSGHVHRFLLKPISPGQTKLLVDSSARRHLELRQNPELLGPVVKDKRAWAMNGSPKVLGLGVVAIAVLVAIIVGATMWSSGEDEAASPTAATTPAPSRALPAESARPIETAVEEGFLPVDASPPPLPDQPAAPALPPEAMALLASAESAFMEGRLAEPAGDNALDYYQAVLGMDPSNTQATQGVSDIIDVLFNQTERALVEERLDDAAATLDQIREIQPTHPRLSFMDVQWSREQQRVKAAQARAQQPVAAVEPAVEQAPPVQAEPARAESAESEAAPGGPPRVEPAPARPAEAVPAIAQAKLAAAPRPSPPPETKPAPRRPSELDRLIATAAQRLEDNDWVSGSDSAKATLLAARELDANNTQIKSLWSDLQDRVIQAGERAAAAGSLDQARGWLTQARELELSKPQLSGLANAIGAAEQAQAESLRADLLAKAVDRLQQDRLTAPAEDNAAFYLDELQGLDPNYRGLDSARLDLSRKLLTKANDASERSDWSGAINWLARAEELAVNQELVAVTGERIRAGTRQAELLAEAMPATELTLVSAKAPTYPRAAVRRDQEGWVELDFTVGRDGTTRDIAVIAAEPEGVFDEAATMALGGYVFEPYQESGQVYERRAQVRVRFSLD